MNDIFVLAASKTGVRPLRLAQGAFVLGVFLMISGLMISGRRTSNLMVGIGVALAVAGVFGMSDHRGATIERGDD
jgi:hypothetical protein